MGKQPTSASSSGSISGRYSPYATAKLLTPIERDTELPLAEAEEMLKDILAGDEPIVAFTFKVKNSTAFKSQLVKLLSRNTPCLGVDTPHEYKPKRPAVIRKIGNFKDGEALTVLACHKEDANGFLVNLLALTKATVPSKRRVDKIQRPTAGNNLEVVLLLDRNDINSTTKALVSSTFYDTKENRVFICPSGSNHSENSSGGELGGELLTDDCPTDADDRTKQALLVKKVKRVKEAKQQADQIATEAKLQIAQAEQTVAEVKRQAAEEKRQAEQTVAEVKRQAAEEKRQAAEEKRQAAEEKRQAAEEKQELLKKIEELSALVKLN